MRPPPLKKYNSTLKSRPSRAEIISYNKLANADASLNTTMDKAKAGAATQSDINQAQANLTSAVEEFKKAEAKLQEKIYILDQ